MTVREESSSGGGFVVFTILFWQTLYTPPFPRPRLGVFVKSRLREFDGLRVDDDDDDDDDDDSAGDEARGVGILGAGEPILAIGSGVSQLALLAGISALGAGTGDPEPRKHGDKVLDTFARALGDGCDSWSHGREDMGGVRRSLDT